MNITGSDLYNLIYFFMSISVAFPMFLIPFGFAILDRITSTFEEVRVTTMKIIQKTDDRTLRERIDTTSNQIRMFSRGSRFLLIIFLFISTINVIIGTCALVTDGAVFYRELSKSDAIISLFSLQFIVFLLNFVFSSVIQPNTEINNLMRYIHNIQLEE